MERSSGKVIHASDDDDPGLGGIAIDSAGDITVAGAFYTSIDLGDGALTNAAGIDLDGVGGFNDAFIASIALPSPWR